MENDLVFSTTEHAIVGHLFAVALGTHIVGFLYFLSAKDRIAPRYRTATVLSMCVMAASGYLFYRLGQSWDLAFRQDGRQMVPTGNRFDGGLRYVNWLVTVPVLLCQVLFAFDLARRRVLQLRTVLIASGLAMSRFTVAHTSRASAALRYVRMLWRTPNSSGTSSSYAA